jgi:hypothetical protein
LLESFGALALTRLNQLLGELTTQAEAHSYHPKLRRLTKLAAKETSSVGATRATPARRRAGSKR